jgi:hypothetical protein
MSYPRIIRSEPKMNGRHRWSIRLNVNNHCIEVIANQEEDAIQIAILTDKCEQLEQKVKELSEQQSDVEHNYTYAPT